MICRRERTGVQPDTSVSPLERAHRVLARRAGAEGMVLLENRGILPLRPGARLALFGAGVRHPVIGGTGSGSVNCRDVVTLDQGLREAGFEIADTDWLDAYEASYQESRRAWIQSLYDMSVPGDFNSLYRAHAAHPMTPPEGRAIAPGTVPEADAALFVLSRVSGEGADRRDVPGDYYVSEQEICTLSALCSIYPHVILLLNIGGIMDLSFTDSLPLSAVLLMSQPGMEAGHALADVLSGSVNPSGRLTDTWAMRYEDYPSSAAFSHNGGNLQQEFYEDGIYVGYRYFDSFDKKVRYPFGYGLSYTDFAMGKVKTTAEKDGIRVQACVRNTGRVPGRTTLFLFAACAPGARHKEHRRLAGFAKTCLLAPGQEEELSFRVTPDMLTSFHTGRGEYVLDAGMYGFYAGFDAAHLTPVSALKLSRDVSVRRVRNACPLHDALAEIRPSETQISDWKNRIEADFAGMTPLSLDALCRDMPQPGTTDRPSLSDAVKRALSLLSTQDKARLVCGQPRGQEEDIVGGAATSVPGAAGQTSTRIQGCMLPSMVLADGPAGLRLQQCYETDASTGALLAMGPYEALENRLFQTMHFHEGAQKHYQFCTAIPIGTMLAQTFDLPLMRELGHAIAEEMQAFGVTLWLAPGMNIHRNPLCGRNFEYYSEDPLVSGLMAAALTLGVQSVPGCGTTIKHFACNNQEENRRGVDSIVSERALREIYLRGFELAVRQAQPLAIMTSYNKVNGEHTANSHDLCTQIAREEWGFNGLIMTDWLTTNQKGGSSAAKCVSAGNDLVMPGLPSDIREIQDALEAKEDLSLSMEDLDACCARILSVMERTTGL